MILVDTSVWVDHLKTGNERLAGFLDAGQVLCHPFIIGELALGNLKRRDVILTALQDLPRAAEATHVEVLHFIQQHSLMGRGIGYADAHILCSALLTPDALLWTQDKALAEVARALSLASEG